MFENCRNYPAVYAHIYDPGNSIKICHLFEPFEIYIVHQNRLSFFNFSQQLNRVQPVTSHSWERGENQKTNTESSWDEDGLIGEAKAMHTRKAEKGIQTLLPISRELFSYLRKAGVHHM